MLPQLDASATQSLHLALRPLDTPTISSSTQTRSERWPHRLPNIDRPASVPLMASPFQPPTALNTAHPLPTHTTTRGTFASQVAIPPHLHGLAPNHLAGHPHLPPQQGLQASTHFPNLGLDNASLLGASQRQPGVTSTSPHMHMFHHFVGQSQRTRAAAGQHGVGNQPGQIHINGDGTTSQQNHPSLHPPITFTGNNPTANPPLQNFTTSYIREGPNGQRWQVTVNQNTITVPAPGTAANPLGGTGHDLRHGPHTNGLATAGLPGLSLGEYLTQPLLSQSGPMGHFSLPAASVNPMQGVGNDVQPEVGPTSTDALTDGLSESELASLSTSEIRELTRRLRERQAAMERERWSLLEQIAMIDRRHAETLMSRFGNDLPPQSSAPSERVAADLQPSSNPTNPSPTSLYLLSSPSGPYGLVVAPTGVYATDPMRQQMNYTQNLNPALPQSRRLVVRRHALDTPHLSNPLSRQASQQSQSRTRSSANLATRSTSQRGQEPANQPAQQPQQQPREEAQPAERQQQQLGDLVRILLPLGGHFWLLVRLLGFVYFFTGGAGWRRTILFLLGALIVFLAQTGVLGGFRETVWAPVRRHLEGLLPPPDEHVQGAAALQAAHGAEGDHRRPEGQHLDPTITAARLLRETEERRRGWMAQNIRRVERALLIFIASLVPGVGERHIAARDAAAAAAAAAAVAAPPVPEQPPQDDPAQENERHAIDDQQERTTEDEAAGDGTNHSGNAAESAQEPGVRNHGGTAAEAGNADENTQPLIDI